MKTIPLTKGYVATVDDADYEKVSAHKWRAQITKRVVYAVRSIMTDGKQRTQGLHRFIMDLSDPKIEVDHKNHNGLDCCRDNLRVCNRSQNGQNQRKQHDKTSQWKGVHHYKATGKWRAQIMVNGTIKSLGLFTDPIDAAKAYDQAARRYFGNFSHCNLAVAA